MTHITRKQTLRSLSLSYQKKDVWLRPYFFLYDTDFLEFESFDFIDHIISKSVSYQKKDERGHPFGMTTTKTLRSVFS